MKHLEDEIERLKTELEALHHGLHLKSADLERVRLQLEEERHHRLVAEMALARLKSPDAGPYYPALTITAVRNALIADGWRPTGIAKDADPDPHFNVHFFAPPLPAAKEDELAVFVYKGSYFVSIFSMRELGKPDGGTGVETVMAWVREHVAGKVRP
jgi:hypothetical protein